MRNRPLFIPHSSFSKETRHDREENPVHVTLDGNEAAALRRSPKAFP